MYLKLLMAHFVVGVNILIGSYRFDQAKEVTVKSSWQNLADTAEIKLPFLKGKITKGTRESLASLIKEGDRAEISLSYQGMHGKYEYKEFSGFVRRVNPQVPLVLECEDAVYLLRKVNIEKAWKATTLKEVISYIVQEANKVNKHQIKEAGNVPDVKFEKFRLDNVNGAEALQQIKEQYGLVAYFDDLTLYVGLAYTDQRGSVNYDIGGDHGNVIDSNLTYRRSEDNNIRLKAVAVLKDNKKIEVEVPEGKKAGEQRTQFYYNITDKATLTKIANQDIEKLRFEGYEGSIETLLIPFARHSMVASISDPDYENRQGKYLIDEVEVKFGRGIRRTVTIGKRL
jgi:hypothetical protein